MLEDLVRAGVEGLVQELAAVLGGDGDRLVGQDQFVVRREPLVDLVVAERRVRAQHVDLFGDTTELAGFTIEHGPDQAGELLDFVGLEVLHQAEVDEGDPSVVGEQVVAGVRVAVERVLPVEAAENKAVERLGDPVAFFL